MSTEWSQKGIPLIKLDTMDTKVDNVGLKMDTAGRKNGYKMSKNE